MAEILLDQSRCKGCGLCLRACPQKLLFLDESKTNNKGYHPVEITKASACAGCCACAWTCPDLCIVINQG